MNYSYQCIIGCCTHSWILRFSKSTDEFHIFSLIVIKVGQSPK